MAHLDYSNGPHIDVTRDTTIPIKTIDSSRLVPVSKISRYDQPIVLANEYFIAYPTSKQGVIRVIAQGDASHVTLSTGAKSTVIRDVAMSQVEQEGKTYLAAIVESVSDGYASIWTWVLNNGGDLSNTAGSIEAHEYFPEFHKQDHVTKIKFIPGTNSLLASYENEERGTTPFINQYLVESKIASYIPLHQALYSPAVDFVYVAQLEAVWVLTKDGCLYDCRPPVKGGLKKVNLPIPLPRPKALVGDGSLVMFDKRLGTLDVGKQALKCSLNLSAILGDNHKLVQYHSRAAIILDVSQNQLFFITIGADGIFKDLSIFKMDVDILDVSVTKNLENNPDVMFDSYLFHAKGLAILQVGTVELGPASEGGVVFKAKKQQPQFPSPSSTVATPGGGSTPKSTKKKQKQQSQKLDDSNLERVVKLASEKLVESGQFVTRQELENVKAEHEKWVNEASSKFEKLLDRFEKLMDGTSISRTAAPSPLSIPGGSAPGGGAPAQPKSGTASRIPSETMNWPPGLRKESPLSQDASIVREPSMHHHDSIWSDRSPFQQNLWTPQQAGMEGSWSSIASSKAAPQQSTQDEDKSYLLPTLSDSSESDEKKASEQEDGEEVEDKQQQGQQQTESQPQTSQDSSDLLKELKMAGSISSNQTSSSAQDLLKELKSGSPKQPPTSSTPELPRGSGQSATSSPAQDLLNQLKGPVQQQQQSTPPIQQSSAAQDLLNQLKGPSAQQQPQSQPSQPQGGSTAAQGLLSQLNGAPQQPQSQTQGGAAQDLLKELHGGRSGDNSPRPGSAQDLLNELKGSPSSQQPAEQPKPEGSAQDLLNQVKGTDATQQEEEEFPEDMNFEQIVGKMTQSDSKTTISKLLQKLNDKYEPDTLFMDTGKRNKKREQIIILSAIASLSNLFNPTQGNQSTALNWMFDLLQLIKANDIHHQASLAVETLNKVKEQMINEPDAKKIRDKIEYLVRLI